MEYIAIVERNIYCMSTTILYCQWTGNEAEMEKLLKFIEVTDAANLDLGDEVTTFKASRQRIPEAAVDIHVGLTELGKNGYYDECLSEATTFEPLFVKCSGKFVFPERKFKGLTSYESDKEDAEDESDEEGEGNIDCDRGLALDKVFEKNGLKKYFKA